jgi:hypothetical protein
MAAMQCVIVPIIPANNPPGTTILKAKNQNFCKHDKDNCLQKAL